MADISNGAAPTAGTRRLVVYEADPANAAAGRFVTVDPLDATAIPIPAFRYGVNRPTVGGTKGQAFISTQTGIASVWDGAQWTDIAVPVVVPYADDSTLLGDTPPLLTVGLSEDTGNMFTFLAGGWVPMGPRVYPTQAGMTADTPADGTLGFATDTGDFALRTGGAWAALTHQGVNVGTTAPPTPVQADMWLDTSGTDPMLKFYDGANWAEAGGGDTQLLQAVTNGPVTVDLPTLLAAWEHVEIFLTGDNVLNIQMATAGGHDLDFKGVQTNADGVSSQHYWEANGTTAKQFFPDGDRWSMNIKGASVQAVDGAYDFYFRSSNGSTKIFGRGNVNVGTWLNNGFTFTPTGNSYITVVGVGKK